VERLEECIFANDRITGNLIRFLGHNEIERAKWDGCIAGSSFETLYPYSWYLDLVSPGWEALVKGDYDMVMPLTHTRKYRFHFLLQPILAQQLGVFSRKRPEEEDLQEFIRGIPGRFMVVDICLNCHNLKLPEGTRKYNRVNYELDLRDSATTYSENTRRNLQKGLSHPFEFRNIDAGQYLDLKFSPEEEITVDRDYLENLFRGLTEMKRAEIFGLFLEDELQAAAILGYAESRVIYMNGCSNTSGKETRAMFVLMDRLINLSREKYPVFDFEGSNLPGIARFFDGFGGFSTVYPRIVKTKIPFFWWKGQ
jgi:hypothetical protein